MHSLDSVNEWLTSIGEQAETSLEISLADYQSLLEELAQEQEQSQSRATRIQHLEQALDQALVCLEELRSQIQNQQFLEMQLANTEDYASVQQQAIVRLKQQLVEQQQALDAQILETQQRDQAIQELLITIEQMTQAQHREVERLRSRLVQDQQEVATHRSKLGKHLHDLQAALESRQQRVSELEAESLTARTLSVRLQSQLEMAQQQIKELSTRLSQHRLQLEQLETQLEQSQAGDDLEQAGRTLAEAGMQNAVPSAPTMDRPTPADRTSVSRPSRSDAALPAAADRSEAADRVVAFALPRWKKTPSVEELEQRLAQQLAQQARWQHQQHELETDRDRLNQRVQDLEQHVTDMQEQILRQAKQETEYETAVQYWKDQYAASQQQLSQLKEMAEQLLLQSSAGPEMQPLLELLQTLQPQPAIAPPEVVQSVDPAPVPPIGVPIPPLALPRFTTVELPEFLMRRRAAQQARAMEVLPNT